VGDIARWRSDDGSLSSRLENGVVLRYRPADAGTGIRLGVTGRSLTNVEEASEKVGETGRALPPP
jgi:hypothetical protein